MEFLILKIKVVELMNIFKIQLFYVENIKKCK
jgi:hypothetical protein